MKLGISYNIFDGEELLEGSIKQIRDQVDYVSVVCQTTSNFGKPCSDDLLPLLKRLKKENLVDEVLLYSPQVQNGGHFNEIQKRNIGLQSSLKAGCSHHMSMDCDEYYIPEEFKKLKILVKEGDYDSSFCQMMTYYKSWDYILDPPEDYYVALITKIDENSSYVFCAPSPVFNDPTRRVLGPKNSLILKRDQVQMHHGSYIRNDIRAKLENSSASENFNRDIENLVEHYNNWEYPEKVLWGGLPTGLKIVKQIDPLFTTSKYEQTILFKFPTRSRPERAFEVLDATIKNIDIKNNFMFLMTLDHDDLSMNNAEVIEKLKQYPNMNIVLGESNTKVEAINRDLNEFTKPWDILILLSDDMVPIQKGFDNIIRQKMSIHFSDLDGVLWFNDGYQKNNLNTLCILGKSYYDRFSYIYHPAYKSLYCDNEFTEVAKKLNKQLYFNTVIIEHKHFSINGNMERFDELYKRNESLVSYDAQVFHTRKLNNFQ